jgi:glycosyltransferase involved in cell wall biosynthesis
MIDKSQLRVSLVIPVYNEESHLAFCLDAIAKMTAKPFEVIVVDNNSTDDSAAIARRYSFVRLITESHQGVTFARDAGFNAARGEIIGRIDADTVLNSDWVVTVQHIFAEQQDCDAVTGSVEYYDIPLKRTVATIDLWFRTTISRKLGNECFLLGANMAIRRSVWLAVRDEVCNQKNLHEDFDLAVHVTDKEYTVRFDPRLHVAVSARCMDYDPRSFYTYMLANPRTYAVHGRHSQRAMYQLIAFMFVMYLPLRFLYRTSDPWTGKFSLRYLFDPYLAHASPLNEPPIV